MPEARARGQWYERPGLVLAALVLFWPAGLVLVWTQKRYTAITRVGLSVALPLATIMIMVAAVTIGSAASQPARLSPSEALAAASPAMTSNETSSEVSAITATPAVVATAEGAPKDVRSSSSTQTTPSIAGPAPGSDPAPVVPGAPQARFTMNGSCTDLGVVSYGLKAGQTAGIAKYEWWVTAIDMTLRYTGPIVTESYVGHAPQSVLLVTTDSAGKRYSSSAIVKITDEVMFAEAK